MPRYGRRRAGGVAYAGLNKAFRGDDAAAVLGVCAQAPEECVPIALQTAAAQGNTRILVAILDEFKSIADVNDSLLHGAAEGGHVDACTELLARGASLTTKCSRNGDLPLHVAVKKSYELTRLFLERGADPNAFSDIGYTPMHVVRDAETARLLLAHGANPNAKLDSKYGWPPLRFTDRGLDTCRVLVEHGADLNLKDNAGCTPLFWVSTLDVAQYFVEHGADVCCVARDGFTPLHVFTRANQDCAAMCTLLLERGALVDAPTKEGNTPLMIHCASCATREVCELLIRRGANVNAQNDLGETPLILAARGREKTQLDACKFLVEHGADVNVMVRGKDKKQCTTPLLACGSLGVFAFLVNNTNANVLVKTERGETALHRLLRIPGEYNLSSEERAAETALCARCCETLLERGVGVNAVDAEGMTPLHLVQSTDACNVLLRGGADVNAINKGNDAQTPLLTYLASKNATVDVVKMLLEHGAQVDILGGWRQRTPLMRASEMCSTADVCQVLLDWGADVNAVNSNGETALHLASTNETSILLLRRGANVNALTRKPDARTPLHEVVYVQQPRCGNAARITDHDDDDDTFERCWTLVVTFGADPTFEPPKDDSPYYWGSRSALAMARRSRQEHSRVVQLLLRARELRVMVCLMSPRRIPRLRAGSACVLHLLPADVVRELREFLLFKEEGEEEEEEDE